jgi:hypothetical protein
MTTHVHQEQAVGGLVPVQIQGQGVGGFWVEEAGFLMWRSGLPSAVWLGSPVADQRPGIVKVALEGDAVIDLTIIGPF